MRAVSSLHRTASRPADAAHRAAATGGGDRAILGQPVDCRAARPHRVGRRCSAPGPSSSSSSAAGVRPVVPALRPRPGLRLALGEVGAQLRPPAAAAAAPRSRSPRFVPHRRHLRCPTGPDPLARRNPIGLQAAHVKSTRESPPPAAPRRPAGAAAPAAKARRAVKSPPRTPPSTKVKAPKVGFVSLGCPKALVDSERIITRAARRRLRDRARIQERRRGRRQHLRLPQLGQAGEPRRDRRGDRRERPRDRHRLPRRREGPHHSPRTRACSRSPARTSTRQVMEAVHDAVPPLHDPFVDLVPPEGLRLTPRHYAYLKISEGCNNKCCFCIIPDIRGRLASRPANHVMAEAERLVKAGVKELLVISQDTSAYGLDIKYAESTWKKQPLKARFFELTRGAGLARRVGAPALRLPLSARRRRHPADGGGQDPALSRHPLPARLAERPEGDAPPRRAGQGARAHRQVAQDLPGSRDPLDLHRRLPRRDRRRFPPCSIDWLQEARAHPRRLLQVRGRARREGERPARRRCPRR